MSKKSRRRNKLLAAMVGLAGASKLGILPMGSTVGKGSSDIQAIAGKARKAGLRMPTGARAVATATTLGKRSFPLKTGPDTLSPFSFLGLGVNKKPSAESIKKFKASGERLQKRRDSVNKLGFKDMLNKLILGKKTQLNMGGEAKIKTKLNGVLKTKTY